MLIEHEKRIFGDGDREYIDGRWRNTAQALEELRKVHVLWTLGWCFTFTALLSLSAVIRREHIRKLLYLLHAFLVIKHILYFIHQIVQLFHRLFKLLPCKILFPLKLFEYCPCLR